MDGALHLLDRRILDLKLVYIHGSGVVCDMSYLPKSDHFWVR